MKKALVSLGYFSLAMMLPILLALKSFSISIIDRYCWTLLEATLAKRFGKGMVERRSTVNLKLFR